MPSLSHRSPFEESRNLCLCASFEHGSAGCVSGGPAICAALVFFDDDAHLSPRLISEGFFAMKAAITQNISTALPLACGGKVQKYMRP